MREPKAPKQREEGYSGHPSINVHASAVSVKQNHGGHEVGQVVTLVKQ